MWLSLKHILECIKKVKHRRTSSFERTAFRYSCVLSSPVPPLPSRQCIRNRDKSYTVFMMYVPKLFIFMFTMIGLQKLWTYQSATFNDASWCGAWTIASSDICLDWDINNNSRMSPISATKILRAQFCCVSSCDGWMHVTDISFLPIWSMIATCSNQAFSGSLRLLLAGPDGSVRATVTKRVMASNRHGPTTMHMPKVCVCSRHDPASIKKEAEIVQQNLQERLLFCVLQWQASEHIR